MDEDNLLTLDVNYKTTAKTLFDFITRYLPFEVVLRLYKLLKNSIEEKEED